MSDSDWEFSLAESGYTKQSSTGRTTPTLVSEKKVHYTYFLYQEVVILVPNDKSAIE